MNIGLLGGGVFLLLAVVFLLSAVRIFREYERGVVFTFGRFWQVKGPGLVIIIPVIQQALDAQTDSWGIKVSNVEIKQVDLTESMIRAIARQAEAERERRAKVIHA